MLRPALLTLHTNPSLGMRQPHRTLRLVDVLSSSAGRAKKLHADVFGVDVAQITLVGVFVYRQDLVQKRGHEKRGKSGLVLDERKRERWRKGKRTTTAIVLV